MRVGAGSAVPRGDLPSYSWKGSPRGFSAPPSPSGQDPTRLYPLLLGDRPQGHCSALTIAMKCYLPLRYFVHPISELRWMSDVFLCFPSLSPPASCFHAPITFPGCLFLRVSPLLPAESPARVSVPCSLLRPTGPSLSLGPLFEGPVRVGCDCP